MVFQVTCNSCRRASCARARFAKFFWVAMASYWQNVLNPVGFTYREPNREMDIILLAKLVFELLKILKSMGVHHLINVMLGVHSASDNHQLRRTSRSHTIDAITWVSQKKIEYHNVPHIFVRPSCDPHTLLYKIEIHYWTPSYVTSRSSAFTTYITPNLAVAVEP